MVGACAFISLTDNGVVIDEKIKEKIFEPFYITGNQGKGPRLPVAYRIIKQHQGSMRIRDGWDTVRRSIYTFRSPGRK